MQGVKVFDELPEGWQYIPGAPTTKEGRWVYNSESRFSKRFERGLVRHRWLRGTNSATNRK